MGWRVDVAMGWEDDEAVEDCWVVGESSIGIRLFTEATYGLFGVLRLLSS